MTQQVLSVAQINEYIRELIDSNALLAGVAVMGEISNYKVYPSGHHYFTIKDECAALRCVMFRGNAVRIRFRPENGMKVIVVGKISVFPRDGVYQLYCTNMYMDGIGDLHAAFEQLKAKLMAKGLFDPAHKKPIPKHPKTIGIVTSSAGAAVHDILQILRKRYPLVKVLLFPVRVQGPEAPAEISAAIRYANHHNLADLLIVGRGGGSIEDLWAFNDERVAYAIYESTIPVISAVGHEPDVTISDYVADLRAATPSNAAELAVPDQDSLRQSLDAMYISMAGILRRHIKNARNQLSAMSKSSSLTDPKQYSKVKRQQLMNFSERLVAAQKQIVFRNRQNYTAATAKLDAMSPLKVLMRGYTMAHTEAGELLRSVKQVLPGDLIRLQLSDGIAEAQITQSKENII